MKKEPDTRRRRGRDSDQDRVRSRRYSGTRKYRKEDKRDRFGKLKGI
jgi:hypothetical protein